MSIRQWITNKWIIAVLSLTGMVLYFIQSWQAAFSLRSSLDEGVYLLKGFLMANGTFTPYQPYGFWMNKMPLSFLIPGWVQVIFEPGLRTGRYYALILSLLILVGTWLAAYRLSGKTTALIVVWLLAINPVGIKMYSQAISQGLVAAMLVWTLVLLLGLERKTWEILAGSATAALIVMTRENMLPVIPFFAFLVFWQHGKKKGIQSIIVMAVVLLAIHAVYYPDILQNWAKWLPRGLTPFLDNWRIRPTDTPPVYYETTNWYSTLFILLQGLRWHFAATAGVGLAWILTSWQRLNKDKNRMQIALVLSLLYLVLIAAHIWASLGNNYCTYCFPGYLAFFSPIGLLIIAALIPFMSINHSRWFLIPSIGLVLLLTPLIGYGSNQDVVRSKLFPQLREFFFNLPLPWIRSGGFTFGEVTFWQVLSNKYGWSFEQIRVQVLPILIPILYGFLIAVLIIILARIISLWTAHRKINSSFSTVLLCLFFLCGILATPSIIMGGGVYTYDCGSGVVDDVEAAGLRLRSEMPAGSKIDWRTSGISPVLLLYLDQPQLFPPQINGIYSYINSKETDQLVRYGLWNRESSEAWLNQADIVMAEPPLSHDFEKALRSYKISELPPITPLFICGSDRYELQIFMKSP
jgi:hypothetical protein